MFSNDSIMPEEHKQLVSDIIIHIYDNIYEVRNSAAYALKIIYTYATGNYPDMVEFLESCISLETKMSLLDNFTERKEELADISDLLKRKYVRSISLL